MNMGYTIGLYNAFGSSCQKAIITANGKTVALMDARGVESNVECLKRHLERVMSKFKQAVEFVNSGKLSSKYTPAPIEGFEYGVNDARMALLRYKGYIFAQLDLRILCGDLNTMLRFIYNTAQSYIRYQKSFVDGKDSDKKGKSKKK